MAVPDRGSRDASTTHGGGALMRTIFKYPLRNHVDNDVHMLVGATLRRVAMQNQVCIWAEVDTNGDHCVRRFRIIGTGWTIPDQGQYIGSCDDGPYVWHVIELPVS
jgi:hypothetical protein